MRSKFKWIFTLLVAFTMQFSFAQEKTVTGVVSDDSGPLPGANVVVKGTTRGVQTDLDGKYAIQTKAGETLVFSFIGLDDQSRTVGAANTVSVKLSQANVKLEEVVVQGYRTVTKKKAVTAAASVSARTIENRPNASVINTLQGQLAGVNITANTGQPGAKSTVVIRGVGTITGNTDPLYVIDGFPSNSDNFRSINPNDIASVDVLKDAAATSEYGSRGSNGVIVIKTRKGTYGDGKAKFRYSTQYGINELQTPKFTYANAKQLLKLEQMKGVGRGATLTDAEIEAWDIDTDWVNYFLRPGTSTNHNFSVENSSKNLNSFTSVSYYTQDGILESTGLKRFTLRNNLSGKSENDKFNYTLNVGLGYSKNNQATNLGTGAINQNYINGSFLGAPYLSPDQYVNSFQLYQDYDTDGTLLFTPLFLIDKLKTFTNLTDELRLNTVGEASYKFGKNITARSRTSAEMLSIRTLQVVGPDSFNALLFSSTVGQPSYEGGNFNGSETINQSRQFFFNQLFQLSFDKTYGKHTFNLTGNAEYNHSLFNSNNFTKNGLDPRTFVPNTGQGYALDVAANDNYAATVSASKLRNDLISYFGSFDYDYDSRYGLVASYRYDGSSRFIEDNQFDSFWSVGARWNIDEESFMDSATFIDVLKLRGSYGTVGNQRIVDGTVFAGINPPAFADIYSNAGAPSYNNVVGYNITLGYPDLRWETTKQYNVGLDFEMFKSRLRGSVDYYNKETVDLYLPDPVTPGVGDLDDSILKNTSATITNSGIELNLAYDIIRNVNTTFTIRANGSFNENKFDNYAANGGVYIDPVNPYLHSENGSMIDEPFLYPYVGVNPINGNLVFEDINGNPTETPTDADRRLTGKNRLPVYQGGFGFDFDYKGFFASSTFTFAADVWRLNFDEENVYDFDNIGQFNVSDDLLNAWTTPGQVTDIPSMTASNAAADDNSDRFLKDASYIRLRNAQIGYRFPKKMLEKTFLTDLSITLQGENLFNITKWTGFDPESDRDFDVYQYPTPRIYTFGIDLKF